MPCLFNVLQAMPRNHSVSGFKLVPLNINKLTTHIDEIRIF